MPDVDLERSDSLFALWCNLEEAFQSYCFKISVPYSLVYPLKHLWEKFGSFSVRGEIGP